MTGYTVRRYQQLYTFPETIEQELRHAVCECRQTDRFKENYSIDINTVVYLLALRKQTEWAGEVMTRTYRAAPVAT